MSGACTGRVAPARWPARKLQTAAAVLWLCACVTLGVHAVTVRTEMAAVAQRPLIVIGSSTASGIGASHQRGWVESVRSLGYNVTSHAVPGSTIFDALESNCVFTERCLPEVAQGALLLVHFPTNEVAQGRSIDEIAVAYERIARWAEARDIDFVFVSVQPRNLEPAARARLQELDRLLARSYPSHYLSVYSALATRDGRVRRQYSAGDNIHLNDSAHAMIAQEVHRLLLTRGAVAPTRSIVRHATSQRSG